MTDFGAWLGPASNLAREGLSANAALKVLREAGMGIRRQDFLKAYGELKAAVGARNSLLGLPLMGRPTGDMIGEYASAGASGFSHIVQMISVNRNTNEVTTRRLTVQSDRLLTRQEAEEWAMTRHAEGEYDPESILIGMALEEVRHYGDDGE